MTPIGVNENSALDLAVLLKSTDIPVKRVRKGDIIVDDHNVWTVVNIEKDKENDAIVLCEKDGNNLHVPVDEEVTILVRSIVRKGKG